MVFGNPRRNDSEWLLLYLLGRCQAIRPPVAHEWCGACGFFGAYPKPCRARQMRHAWEAENRHLSGESVSGPPEPASLCPPDGDLAMIVSFATCWLAPTSSGPVLPEPDLDLVAYRRPPETTAVSGIAMMISQAPVHAIIATST